MVSTNGYVFSWFFMKLHIICTVQMVICTELYTYNLDAQLYTYNYTLLFYVIRKLCDVIIQKTKVCHGHGQTFI